MFYDRGTMIGRLQGRVVAESSDGTVVLDVGGVGYEVTVPLGTLGRCPRGDDGVLTLTVVTNVREDAITLFGFANESERAAFKVLTAVAGVGPRTAVAVLSVLPVNELVGTVLKGDAKKLQSVPGVGKRIAERLVLELKDKVQAGAIPSLPAGAAGAAVTGSVIAAGVTAAPRAAMGPTGTLVATLVRMGFKQAEAERAAAELAERMDEPMDVLVRAALQMLVK